MFLIINVVLPVGIVVMVFSSPIASNGGDVDDADGLSSARAISIVIASGLAGCPGSPRGPWTGYRDRD